MREEHLRQHLWQGEWIDEAELARRVATLAEIVLGLAQTPPATEAVLEACDRLSVDLEANAVSELAADLASSELDGVRDDLARFLSRSSLRAKLDRELCVGDPFAPTRIDFRRDIFESWAPLGFLVHVAPTNDPSVGFLSVVEGLLAGNACFLKTGGGDSLFPLRLLRALLDRDRSATLARSVFAARIPSQRKDLLRPLFAAADGIAAWGGGEAIEGVRSLAPSGARVIAWGPKISFAYVAAEHAADDATLEAIARDCCQIEQQACASPQVVYVETRDPADLMAFAARLAATLERISPTVQHRKPSDAEAAEVTQVTELTRLESCLEDDSERARVFEPADRSWRVLAEPTPTLRASPLFRSVWVKPLPADVIAATLRPMKIYLQTAALACSTARVGDLAARLLNAGILRITRPGAMLESYMGEPHDGVYALQRYCRRISVQWDDSLAGVSSFADITACVQPALLTTAPILDKDAYQRTAVDRRYAELHFRSGGSSGAPKLSVFTYDDYHRQMAAAAEGLYASGLDPRRDRCMNLFYGGGLYGGFLSFFTILEHLRAVQFPMAAHMDFEGVARAIAEFEVDTLLGMPSYLLRLFHEQGERLRTYGCVRKIFYGGEHLDARQQERLRHEFGVTLIRSASYGSVDAGPLAFQCAHCSGTVHHLHTRLHHLEIVALDRDVPAPSGSAGRLIFSSRVRTGQSLARYEIGDLGRWVDAHCPCGRTAPRFELLGRHGDVFRAGATFLSYPSCARILADQCAFAGELQLVVEGAASQAGAAERLTVRVADPGLASRWREDAVRTVLLEHYADLKDAVAHERLLELCVTFVEASALERTAGSGKLRRVIDRRAVGDRPAQDASS